MQDLTGKVTDSTLTAVEWNQLPQEVQNVIAALGITLSAGDLDQLNKAIAGYSAVGQFMTGAGVADAYTANAPAPRINPAARVAGMVIRFTAPATNTGPCTLNAFGAGVDDIKLRGGSADPAAGDIISGKEVIVIDRATYFELVRTGQVITTVVTATDATWAPQPDTQTIKFEAVGAGGGGGGAQGQGAGTAAAGGGGGGGATVIIQKQVVDATYNITIGAGGTGGTAVAGNGAAGGDTTVVSTNVNITAGGGAGGSGMTGIGGTAFSGGTGGGSATGGDINITGGAGNVGRVLTGDLTAVPTSGDSTQGQGRTTNGVGAGANADSNRKGVGGNGGVTSNVATNYAGGDGADGIVIVTEYL